MASVKPVALFWLLSVAGMSGRIIVMLTTSVIAVTTGRVHQPQLLMSIVLGSILLTLIHLILVITSLILVSPSAASTQVVPNGGKGRGWVRKRFCYAKSSAVVAAKENVEHFLCLRPLLRCERLAAFVSQPAGNNKISRLLSTYFIGDPGASRTHNLFLRTELLYPLSYQATSYMV